MNFEEILDTYKNQIDTIDFEIIYLLSRRFQIWEEIAGIKKIEWIEAFKDDRWNELLQKLIEEADDKQIDKKLVEDLWDVIHKETLRRES